MRPTPVYAAERELDSRAVLPVWGRIGAQLLLFSLIALAIVAVDLLFAPQMGASLQRGISLLLAALPALLWLLFSALPESRVERPRRLLGVAVVSGLCAATFGLPLAEDFFVLEQWLPLESVIQRIVGYSFTAGIVDVGIKFLVLRYMVLPQRLRARSDVIAYAMAGAVGYGFCVNLSVIWRLDPVWELAAILVLTTVVTQFASSMALALGLVASVFTDAFPAALPASLLVGAVAAGLIAPQAPGLISGPLGIAGSATRPHFAVGFLLAALLLAYAVAAFLYSNAERRQRETLGGRGASGGI